MKTKVYLLDGKKVQPWDKITISNGSAYKDIVLNDDLLNVLVQNNIIKCETRDEISQDDVIDYICVRNIFKSKFDTKKFLYRVFEVNETAFNEIILSALSDLLKIGDLIPEYTWYYDSTCTDDGICCKPTSDYHYSYYTVFQSREALEFALKILKDMRQTCVLESGL